MRWAGSYTGKEVKVTYIQLSARARNLTGQRFGRLVVLGPLRKTSRGIYWHCLCDCGSEKQIRQSHLTTGATRSCGCLRDELATQQSTTHGLGKKHPWGIWVHIRARCTNPSDAAYQNYGGRGITVHEEWLNDYAAFHQYVTQLPHYGEPGRSIDRIDNDGNYEPGNVRWATRKEQNQNRRPISK